MPTYEYSCKACQHGFETEQRITADPLVTCPECGAKKLIRLVGTGNFILKGSGWYSDLYSGSGGGSSSVTSSDSSAKTESSKSDSTTSAPAPAASAGD